MNTAIRISLLVSIFISLGLVEMPIPIASASTPSGMQAATADSFGYNVELIAYAPFSFTSPSHGPSGSNTSGGPYPIGFTFSFYGRSYSDFYLSTNGFLSFGEGSGSRFNAHIPKISKPNAIIAPYWGVYGSIGSNSIKYETQGTAPNRKLIVEWNNVPFYYTSMGSPAWFWLILYEGTNTIEFYYFTTQNSQNPSIGIEDEDGWNGLSGDTIGVIDQRAIRFTPPATSARLKFTPPLKDQFVRPGGTAEFPITILNAGDVGIDTFNLTASSSASVSFFSQDGITQLTDTNGDGVVDTGALAQGTNRQFIAKFKVPFTLIPGAVVGATIQARSTVNSTITGSCALRAAVPTGFVQAYRELAATTPYLPRMEIVEPGRVLAKSFTPIDPKPSNLSVAAAPNGNLIEAWVAYRKPTSVYYDEIEFTILDKTGAVVKPITRLVDYSGIITAYHVESSPPALAVAPDGKIGVLWTMNERTTDYMSFRFNTWFAILKADGQIEMVPTKLTNNTSFTPWNPTTNPVIRMQTPALAASGDNSFFLAWVRIDMANSSNTVSNVYLARYDTNGNQQTSPDKVTNDDASASTGYYNPFLVPLQNNRVLLTYDYSATESQLYYRVYGSDLSVVKSPTELLPGLRNYDTHLQAVQLANGSIFLAWYRGGIYGNVSFSFLDGSYNRTTPPISLSNPVPIIGMDSLSITADYADRVVLTWTEADDLRMTDTSVPARPYLFYALVGPTGVVLTPPLVYKTTKYSFEASFIGMGLAPHTAPGVDLYVDAPSFALGSENGNAQIQVSLGNIGGETAASVTLVAILDTSLNYVSASPLPSSVIGQTVTWNLENRAPFTTQGVTLVVQLPGSGTFFPVTLTASSAGTELESSDNTAEVQVIMGSYRLYIPAVRK